MSLRSYSWVRYIKFSGMVSEAILPRRDIAAGTAFATFELWSYMAGALGAIQAQATGVHCCLQVDSLF